MEFGTIGNRLAIRGAKFARTIDRRGAHQITHRIQLILIRLLALGQALKYVLPQAHTAISSGQGQLGWADSAGLLNRHVGRQAGQIVLAGDPVEQGKGRIPGLGNDPVRA